MRRLLLRCYPARWRARYGDEFAAILEDRPLGPFDVADILLGALDAHLHLRGLGAASEHGRGFAMSLRLGGFAAIVGGVLWALAFAGASTFAGSGDATIWLVVLGIGNVALLVALVALSAFQARRYPALVWASFLVPGIGAVVAAIALVAMLIVGDREWIAGMSPWSIWALGTAALVIGSALFGIATWLTGSLSRVAAALLVVGLFVIFPMLGIAVTGGTVSGVVGTILILGVVVAFGAGWAWLGISALRADGFRFRASTPPVQP